MKSKAGLVILAIPQEISPIPEIAKDTMSGFAKRAEESLNNAGVDVIRVKEFINNPKIAVETVDYLNRENIDCLIIKIGAWPSPSIAIDMINKLRRQTPVILWASSDQVTLSLVPACQFHGAFDDMGIEHEFIFAEPEKKNLLISLKKYLQQLELSII